MGRPSFLEQDVGFIDLRRGVVCHRDFFLTKGGADLRGLYLKRDGSCRLVGMEFRFCGFSLACAVRIHLFERCVSSL